MSSVYRIINNEKELDQLIKKCEQTGYASIDFETSGEPFYENSAFPTILGVSYQPGSAEIIPLGHKDSIWTNNYENKLIKFGKTIIENPDITKVAWNTQFEYTWLKRYGIDMKGGVDDGMLAKYMLDEDRPMGLKESVTRFLPEFSGYDLKGQPSSKSGRENIRKFWSNVDMEELSKYCALDCDLTLRLMVFFYTKLQEHGLYSLYRNLLMMGTRVLGDSKSLGINVDRDYLYSLDSKYQKIIDGKDQKMRSIKKVVKFERSLIESRIEKAVDAKEAEIINIKGEIKEQKKAYKKREITEVEFVKFKARKKKLIETRENAIDRIRARELTTNKDLKIVEPINFGSPQQMADMLYLSEDGFKFKIKEYTDSGAPSTAEAVLETLEKRDKSGFIKTLLEHRGLSKLHSTYIIGMMEKLSKREKIHADFLLHGCVIPETIIIGSDKDIRIGDLAPDEPGVIDITNKGLKVLTHNGNFKTITHGVNKGIIETWEIKNELGQILNCTPQHKLLTENGMKTVRAIIEADGFAIFNNVDYISFNKPEKILPKHEEEFGDLKEFKGYIISSYGRLFSKKIKGGQGNIGYELIELKPRKNKRGVPRFGFRDGTGKRYMRTISHLVYKTFISNDIKPGFIIDHKDCRPDNNIKENLQQISYSKNIKRAYHNTRNAFTRGNKNGRTNIDIKTVGKVLRLHQGGLKQKLIMNEVGLNQAHVSKIILKKSWSNIYISKIKKIRSYQNKIVDITVEDEHSYVTRSNYINSNTVTGRLSSRGPNLQNIPRVTTNPDIKKIFIPPPGKLLLQLDYSQAELRVMAAQAGETTMISWFKEGRDIHLATACDKNHWDYDEMLKYLEDENHKKHIEVVKERKFAKTINFGIIYGQGANKLAESMETDVNEAKVYLKAYFKRFPKIRHFINSQIMKAHKEGYVKNVFGRKRRLANALASTNTWEIAEAERQSVNAPIQGAASDYTLFSSILIWEKVRRGELPPLPQVYTVHDSLGFYVDPKDIHYVVPKLTEICANPETMEWFNFQIDDVVMKVDFEVSEINWAELKKYNPETDYQKLVNTFNR